MSTPSGPCVMRSRAGVSREGVVTPARLASSTSTPDNREGAEEDAMVTSRVQACMMGGMTPLLRPLLAPGMAALSGAAVGPLQLRKSGGGNDRNQFCLTTANRPEGHEAMSHDR